jgi:hypothetical protein
MTQNSSFTLVPSAELEEIRNNTRVILEKLDVRKPEQTGEYMTVEQAMKTLQISRSTFEIIKGEKLFSFTKLGRKVMVLSEDILRLKKEGYKSIRKQKK